MLNPLPTLITEGDLKSQHGRLIDFPERFPAIFEVLILASLPEPPTRIRMPQFQSGRVTGFDGILECSGADPYVPQGISQWEFGTEETPHKKIPYEYDRVKNRLDSHTASETTLVIVTSRDWYGADIDKSQWENQKKSENFFKDVKVYDVSDIASWMRSQPTATLRIAKTILEIIPQNFEADFADEFLDIYCKGFQPPIPRTVLFAGRSQVAQKLQEEGLTIGISESVQADSQREAAAFVCASLLETADAEFLNFNKARTIVVQDQNSAKQLALAKNLNIILMDDAVNEAARLKDNNAVVVTEALGGIGRPSKFELSRPTESEFSQALITGGFDHSSAYDIAVRCGRSLSVLRRFNDGEAPILPDWASEAGGDNPEISAALMIGAWKDNHSKDREALERYSNGIAYSQLARKLRRRAYSADPLLSNFENSWSLRAPIDAFAHLWPCIGSDELEIFKQIAHEVFHERKSLKPDPDAIIDLSDKSGYSDILSQGVTQTILILSALGDQFGVRSKNGNCKTFVDELIADLPSLADNPFFLSSYHQQLPYLAEASPMGFIKALEPMLEGDGAPMVELLKPVKREFGLGLHGHFHGVIFALERIAWIPENFDTVAFTLARMAELDPDPDANIGSRPLNSLGDMFLSTAPQTYASVEQRLSVLEEMETNHPDVAYQILRRIAHQRTGGVTIKAKPVFYSNSSKPLTHGDAWKNYDYACKKVIEHSMNSDQSVISIIPEMFNMNDELCAEAVKSIENILSSRSDKERYKIWHKLRYEVARHKNYSDADWSAAPDRVREIENLVERLAPQEPWKSAYLFDYDHEIFAHKDFSEAQKLVEQQRSEKISTILNQNGNDGILLLLNICKSPHHVTNILLNQVKNISFFFELIMAVNSSDDHHQKIFANLCTAIANKHNDNWYAYVFDKGKANELTGEQVISIVAYSDLTPQLVKRINSLSQPLQKSFWEQSSMWGGRDDIKFREECISKWILAHRATEFISNSLSDFSKISTPTLFALGKSVIREISSNPENARRLSISNYVQLLDELRTRTEIILKDVAQLEWPFVSAICYQHERTLILHDLVTTDAEAFVEMLQLACKPDDHKVNPVEVSEDELYNAQLAGSVLFSLYGSKYFVDDIIGFSSLKQWIGDVIERAKIANRERSAMNYLGHVLAGSPDEDGVWPHSSIAEIIETLQSESLETSIQTTRFNQRGAFWGDGIDRHRKQSTLAREWAIKRSEFPRTKNMLEEMARYDEHWAENTMRRDKEEQNQSFLH